MLCRRTCNTVDQKPTCIFLFLHIFYTIFYTSPLRPENCFSREGTNVVSKDINIVKAAELSVIKKKNILFFFFPEEGKCPAWTRIGDGGHVRSTQSLPGVAKPRFVSYTVRHNTFLSIYIIICNRKKKKYCVFELIQFK